MPPVDLTQPGWTIREGQALWRPNRAASEMAGDLMVAISRDGEAIAQFTKTPFPILMVRLGKEGWQADFEMEHRTIRGRGSPPEALVWLALLDYAVHRTPPKRWTLEQPTPQSWVWTNPRSGERLEIFFNSAAP